MYAVTISLLLLIVWMREENAMRAFADNEEHAVPKFHFLSYVVLVVVVVKLH